MDIEAQLLEYTPEQKSAILNQMQQARPPVGEKRLNKTAYDEALIKDILQLTDSASELSEDFWKYVKFYLTSKQNRASPQQVELLVHLFECAKEIPSLDLRENLLFEIGRKIYQQRLVRFDPDNEILFLNSLVANNRAAHAVKLWNSRKNRSDVSTSVEWKANGILYLVNAGRLNQAERIAVEMTRADDNCAVESLMPLFNAYALQIRRGRGGDAARVALKNHCDYFVKTSKIGTAEPEAIAILHALIIGRQWGLASQVMNVFSPEFLAKPEQLAAIERAILMSATSHLTKEEESQFEDFFATVSGLVPPLGVSPVLMSALALSFAVRSDITNAIEIVSFMASKQLEISRTFQIELIKRLIQSNDVSALQHNALQPLIKNSKNMATILKRGERKLASKLINAISEVDVPLTSEVAFRLLASRLVSLENSEKVSWYGQFTESQSYIWYMCAMNKLRTLPLKLVTPTPDVETLVYMCQAFVRQEPDFDTAIKKLFAMLSSLPDASPAQAAIVYSTLTKLRAGRRLQLRPPQFKPAQKSQSGGTIAWARIAEALSQPKFNKLCA